MTDAFRPAVVIPVYDHPEVIRELTARIAGAGLPVILVNDGSHEPCASVLRQTAREVPGTLLHELPCNGGKGTACIAGMRVAHARGFTHVLGCRQYARAVRSQRRHAWLSRLSA